MNSENQPDAAASILARVNALVSTRRKGGRRRAVDDAIRAQSANYAAANREAAPDVITERQVAFLRRLKPELSEARIRGLTREQAGCLIDVVLGRKPVALRK